MPADRTKHLAAKSAESYYHLSLKSCNEHFNWIPQGWSTKAKWWTAITLVLATPISGPALIWTPQSVSLDIELPTVFVMPTVRARRSLQYLRAISVSAVSPGKHWHLDFSMTEDSNDSWKAQSSTQVTSKQPHPHLHNANAAKTIFKDLLIVYVFQSGLKKIPIQDKSGPLANIILPNMQKAVSHWLFRFFSYSLHCKQ